MYSVLYIAMTLTIFNFVQACGQAPFLADPIVTPVDNPRTESQRGPTVDPALLEAVQQWKEDCLKFSALHCGSFYNRVTAIKVIKDFGPDERSTIGRCNLRTYGLIVFDRVVYIRADMLKTKHVLRAVLAHEMGHCAFLKGHVEDRTHLMAAYLENEYNLGTLLPAMLQKFYADVQANNLPGIGGVSDDE